MGNDGGSIPSRSELVKLKSAPKNVHGTSVANNEHAWAYCALSRAALAEPLASDAFGKLYNKESIIRYILDRDAFGHASIDMSHVTSLKDIVELRVCRSEGHFICEVTRRDMNGACKFVYLCTCGHVFAAEALSQVPQSSSRECLVCSQSYEPLDVIPLNPDADDVRRLADRRKLLLDRGLTHTGSPIKRKKKRKAAAVEEKEEEEEEREDAVVKTSTRAPKKNSVARSAVLESLLHKTDERVQKDHFMTRGASSRVG